VKSHMCLLNNQLKCDECDEPTFYKNEISHPRAIFRVFSMESRIRAWFNNRDMARALRYRHAYVSDPEWQQRRSVNDIFDGKAYRDLAQAGYFSNEIDIALMVAADGVRIFDRYVSKIQMAVLLGLCLYGLISSRNRQADSVFLIIAVNLNLSPTERFLDDNVIPLGIVPGPKSPTNLQSFLAPIINELQRLSGTDINLVTRVRLWFLCAYYQC
jgi:hypothetical protein